MNALLLAVSIASIVLQNCLLNHVSKKTLHGRADTYFYNAVMYAICVLLFGAMAIGRPISLFTVLLGIAFGFMTVLASYTKMIALSQGPLHITTLIITASLLIPTLSGVLLFHTPFSPGKLIAAMALVIFIYLSAGKSGDSRISRSWAVVCAISFSMSGLIGITQQIHQASPHRDELAAFLAVSFSVSFLFAAFMSRGTTCPARFKLPQYAVAALCGLCAFTMNIINLKLSGEMPSQLFFPAVNGVPIILIGILSICLFKEKTTRRQLIGLVGGLVSLLAIGLL